MRFFIDTAKVEDIKKANDMGVICGVTTNPSLIAKEGRDFKEVIKEITSIVDGPISGRRRRHDRGRKRDRSNPSEHGCKNPYDSRRSESLQSADSRRHQDKRNTDLYCKPGTAGRKSRCNLCFSVPGKTG